LLSIADTEYTGVSLDAAAKALAVVSAAPDLAAIVLTEVNPTHDPDGRQLHRYVDAVGGALVAALGEQ
jgi:arginase